MIPLPYTTLYPGGARGRTSDLVTMKKGNENNLENGMITHKVG